MSFTPLLTATLIFISSFLQAGDFILLPEGKKMEAEDWDAPDEPKVEDSLASGGKAVLLRRDGGALTKTLKLERSHYALSIWARCSEETYLLPAYLELSVGSKTYRMRTRYNIDRNVYLAGYLDSFGIHKHQGYEETETFSRAKGYHRYSFKKGVPWWGENTRFYFPVDAAGDVKLQLRMGARSKVDLLIDRLQLRDVLAHLPQGARKKHRAFFSADEEKAWERLKLRDSAAKQFAADTAQRGYQGQNWSDDTCWDYVPSPYMPRSQQAGPCPVHGNEVFRRGGYANPWKGEPRAFHVRCFVGNEAYPSNAIEKGDLTSGKYPDDGWGYVHTDAKSPFPKDQEMLFVGRRVYNRWQSIPNHVMELARRWVITRSTEAAHQAGVFLAAIAYHYPGYDYRFQSRRTLIGHGKGTWVGEPPRETDQGWTVAFNDWGCGKIFYCGWTGGPNNEIKIMLAYDLLFPFLMKDEGLLRFVGSRIPWIKTFEDLQELLDRHLLAVHSDALIRRQAKSANSGWESSAAVMSVIQDGPEAQRILKELSSRANLDGTNAGGFEDAVVNMLCRDGVGLICSPMYCFGWSRGLIAAGHLSRVGDPELRKRYGMTGPKLASRISAMCRLARGLRIAGSFLPNLGDNNRANKGEGDHFIRELWPLFLNEWKDRRDPRYAALVKRFASPQDLLLKHAEYITDLTEAAERGEPALSSASRAFGGYGAV
ncbi:MAG: hypothetical protein QF473_32325, partial [Planctomycetota bacterium]|nr:hypothetical protein [Planctomycetota bacterium]